MVIRNAGGSVSPDVLKDLAYIGYLSRMIVPGGPRYEVAVVHHNQCGTRYLADDKFRRGFADLIGGDEAELAAEAVTDPEQTVRSDVELLRSAAVLPDTITVSGQSTTSPPAWSPRSSPQRTCTPAHPVPQPSQREHLSSDATSGPHRATRHEAGRVKPGPGPDSLRPGPDPGEQMQNRRVRPQQQGERHACTRGPQRRTHGLHQQAGSRAGHHLRRHRRPHRSRRQLHRLHHPRQRPHRTHLFQLSPASGDAATGEIVDGKPHIHA